MKKQFAYLVTLTVGAILIVTSCNKPSSKRTFSITGYLWDSCGGKPMPGIPLQVSFRELNTVTGGVSDDNIGTATTGNNGYFEIKCKYYSRGTKIDIFNADTRYVYCDNYPYSSNPKQGYYDFGKCFANGTTFSGTAKFILDGTLLPTDTFYAGIGNDFEYITNAKSGDVLEYRISYALYHSFYNSFLKYFPENIYWGIGYADYKSNKHIQRVAVGMCTQADTITNFSITK